MNRIQLGKFYTTFSPFTGDAWLLYRNAYLQNLTNPILEPFAGANNLPKMLCEWNWHSYDIWPEDEKVIQRDTLKNFPQGYSHCITNPPYLDAKLAKKMGWEYHSQYSDLYLESLSLALQYCDYVVAIIPASFINRSEFKERLWLWDKIDNKIFSDTDKGVGVGYWIKEKANQTLYFLNGRQVDLQLDWEDNQTQFNTKLANLGVCLIDNTKGNSIAICNLEGWDWEGHCYDNNRCYVPFLDNRIGETDIIPFNEFINWWRIETGDYFLSPWHSLFKNENRYRKRLSFRQLSGLIGEYCRRKNLINYESN
jgi:hypothetical protein